ncbi:MAG: hypothetical protein LBT90_00075 [Holosporaceae bacterium]|jgi:suppressor for copper-sensitivity B|nr:hypothetical protein [Holosporaceae bacterium]
MKICEKKYCFFLLFIFCFCAFSSHSVEFDVVVQQSQLDQKTIKGSITVSLPIGWKFAKRPAIKALRLDNLKNFLCSPYEKFAATSGSCCRFNFWVSPNDFSNKKAVLLLEISCPACNKICTILHKIIKIHLDFGTKQTSTTDGSETNTGWLSKFLWALLGGIIGGLLLNCMPCVLPVILMKIRSLLKYKHDKILMIKSLTGALAGNYAAFMALAMLLAFLKAGGESVGWGFHFQNVAFLKIVVIILFLLTIHSFGILQFSVSLRLKSEARGVFVENFISNWVSACVALPCTAPFLGGAAVFAIHGSIVDLFAVFLAMATGFSLPYLIVLVTTRNTREKSTEQHMASKWWNRGVEILTLLANYGVAMALLWMLFITSRYYGGIGMLMAGVLFISATICFKMKKNIIASIITATLLAVPTKSPESATGARTGECRKSVVDDYTADVHCTIAAEKIRQTIASAVAQSKVVIFSIDADWCLTCKSNRSYIFGDQRIQEIMGNKSNKILSLRADMTKKNNILTDFIKNYGRIGIPFMVIFGPKAPAGILLSEMPTVDDVLDAIAIASGNNRSQQLRDCLPKR